MKNLLFVSAISIAVTGSAQSYNQDNLELLASVINSEASGESYEEKLRVGNVVLNRVSSKYYPNSIKEVIYQPKQFSGINSYLFRYDTDGDRGDKESIKAAKELLEGKRILPKNIIGFFNAKRATNRKFVKRIADKVVFTSEAHSYFRT